MTDEDRDDLAARQSYAATGIAVARAIAKVEKKGHPFMEMGCELIVHGIRYLTRLPYETAREQMLDYLSKFQKGVTSPDVKPIDSPAIEPVFADILRDIHIAHAAAELARIGCPPADSISSP